MDKIQWAEQQAAALRAGRLGLVDLERVAKVLDNLVRDQRCAFQERFSAIMVAFYAVSEGRGQERVLELQRLAGREDLKHMPSLRAQLSDPDFVHSAWIRASGRIGLEYSVCPWEVVELIGRE